MERILNLAARAEAFIIDMLCFFAPAILIAFKFPTSVWPLILGTLGGALFLLRDCLISPGRLLLQSDVHMDAGGASCGSPMVSLVRQALVLIPVLALIESFVILLRGDGKRLGDLLTETTVSVDSSYRRIMVTGLALIAGGLILIYLTYSGALAITNPLDVKPQ